MVKKEDDFIGGGINNADLAAERAVLSGIMRYGYKAYNDVADIISPRSFSEPSNSIIYKCVKNIYETQEDAQIDIPTILSSAKDLKLEYIFDKKSEMLYLNGLMTYPIDLSNVKKFGMKMRKLEIAHQYSNTLEIALEKLRGITGTEKLNDILAIGEDSIQEFISGISDVGGVTKKLSDGLDELLDDLKNNPVDQMGISTGYKKLDKAIGGGLRRGGIHVVAARTKVGKSTLGINISKHIACNVKVPVLNIDTEMSLKDHQIKNVANESGVTIQEIETGKFGKNSAKLSSIIKAAKSLKSAHYYHECVGGKSIDEILVIIKRWLNKVVGFDTSGRAKPCVIVYDYLKLMDQSSLSGGKIAEYQAIGFMMTKLHDFARKYDVPFLAFVQTNKDGITKEDATAVSQSDRIAWLCTALCIYKAKSDEEIAQDGEQHGTRKLVPVLSRYGSGLEDGEYISMIFNGDLCKITEGKTNLELLNGGESKHLGKSDNKLAKAIDPPEDDEDGPDGEYSNYNGDDTLDELFGSK